MDIDEEIRKVSDEIIRITVAEDSSSPETRSQILGLKCKLYGLKEQQSMLKDDFDAASYWAKQASQVESLKIRAEQVRKNALLPKIIKQLEAWQGGASDIRERANEPTFLADDE